MKLSKSELKEIIKECLVEIFQESLNENSSKRTKDFQKPARIPENHRREILANNVEPRKQLPRVSPLDMKANLTMEDILADTAANTLKHQLAAENRMPVTSDRAASIVSQVDPDQLFGEETASKWAELAFFDQKK